MLGILLLLATHGFWPAASGPQNRQFVDMTRSYTLVLPVGWRQMTPVEGRELREVLPADLATPLILSQIDRFGAVDRWIETGFDGRCLTVVREAGGEPAMTEETLRQVRATANERSSAGGARQEILGLELGQIGKKSHPAIECDLRILGADGRVTGRALEFLVPTGGKSIRFSFRAAPDDFKAATVVFREVAASLEFGSPPEGKKELSDKLQMPLIIGIVVGLILLVLYKTRKG